MSRVDDVLLREVAELWVSRGGDAEGIDFCAWRLKQAVEDLQAEREALGCAEQQLEPGTKCRAGE